MPCVPIITSVGPSSGRARDISSVLILSVAGAWVPNSYFKAAKLTVPRSEGPVPGTSPDAGTATPPLGLVPIGPRTHIAIPPIIGPKIRRLSFRIRDTAGQSTPACRTMPPLHQTSWIWHPELPPGRPPS